MKVVLDPAAREELERVYKEASCAKDRQKAQVLLLATEGIYSYQRLGEIVMRSRATVINWFNAYFSGGLDGLLGDGARPGRPSEMKSEEIASALAKGLADGAWVTSGQVREWLRDEYGIERSGSTVRYWLGKLGGAHKVPRPVHAKKDEALAEEFKAHLYEKLAALDIPQGARVRVWAADEARYGLHDRLRRCWSLRGQRTVKRMQMDYEWGYAYGAVDVVSGESEFLLLPSVNLGFSLMFLRQIAERDPEAHHVVIWDNAGFHQRPGDGTLPANVRLLPLPAYSPELNPVEKLWEIVRDRVANKVHGTITAMDDAVARVLRDMYHAPDMIRSLVGTGWMHLQANASSKTFSINTFGQWYNMAKRFRTNGKAYFAFITTPGIGPTNNLAEQAVRFIVIDRLITQGTRSEKGRKTNERLWTVVGTCSLQERFAFEFILTAVRAYFHNEPAPSLLPASG